jgi:hypothetical protein
VAWQDCRRNRERSSCGSGSPSIRVLRAPVQTAGPCRFVFRRVGPNLSFWSLSNRQWQGVGLGPIAPALLFKQAEMLAERDQGADLVVHFDPDPPNLPGVFTPANLEIGDRELKGR